MSSIPNLLGDISSLDWRDLASCNGIDSDSTGIFFEEYETDPVVARETDVFCLSCPVARQCFQYGKETKSEGVWGGVYLENGKVSKNYNKHKTDSQWKDLKHVLGENVKI